MEQLSIQIYSLGQESRPANQRAILTALDQVERGFMSPLKKFIPLLHRKGGYMHITDIVPCLVHVEREQGMRQRRGWAVWVYNEAVLQIR